MSDDQFNKILDEVNIFNKMQIDKLLSEEFNKMFRNSIIMLTKIEIKDVIKVVRSLENGEIL